MKETIDINLLKENSLSKEFFYDLPDREFQLLKEDIKARDVQIPIEVTRDYTVITGHQRLRAMKELGYKEIEVNVREDLESEEEIEHHLVMDNLLRRHLTLEEKVRIVQYFVVKYGSLRGKPPKDRKLPPFLEGEGKTREKVANLLGISKRSVDKYLKVARLPAEEKEKVLKKQKKMKDALTGDIEKVISSPPTREKIEEGSESEAHFGDSSAREFDPVREIDGEIDAKCVRCGRTAYPPEPEADDMDPRWFVTRLAREFVKSGRRELCGDCLASLYKNLGFTVQRNWEKFLKGKTSLQAHF